MKTTNPSNQHSRHSLRRAVAACLVVFGVSRYAHADTNQAVTSPADLEWIDPSAFTFDPFLKPIVRTGSALPLLADATDGGGQVSLIGSTTDLKSDTDAVLRTDDQTGTISVHSLTFDSSKNPVTLTQLDNTALTLTGTSPVSFVSITKSGTFDSVITGGRLITTQTSFSIQVADGLLQIKSALTGSTKSLVLSGGGTLELASTDSSNNFGGGIFLNSGTLRITSDFNLGAKIDNPNTISLRGGNLEIFGTAVTLGAARVLTVDRGGGAIMTTGSASVLNIMGDNQLQGGTLGILEKTGAGTLVIGGINNYGGGITVTQGTLELRQPNSLGDGARVPISLNDKTVFNLHSDSDALNFNNDITVLGDGMIDYARLDPKRSGGTFLLDTLTVPSGMKTAPVLTLDNSSADGSVLRFTGAVQLGSSLSFNVTPKSSAGLFGSIQGGSAGMTKNGTGTLTIGGALDDRFSGPVVANAGVLALAKTGGALAVPGNLVVNGAQVRLDFNDQISDASDITVLQGNFNLNSRSDAANSLTISGGALNTGVGGKLFLTLPVGAALPASIPGGPVAVSAVPALTISGGATTISSGGEINATTVQVSGGVNTVLGGGQFTVGSGGLTMAGNASPSFMFTADGATPGRLSLSGNVTYTGTLGMAALMTTGALAQPGVIDLNGAQRDFSIGDDGTAAVDMLISTNIINGSLKKSGTGTLRLTGNNTYTGGTTISAGMLELGSAGALGSGPLVFNSGQLNIRSDANITFTNPLNSTSADVVLNVDRDTIGGPTKGTVTFAGGVSIAANQLMLTGNRTVLFTGNTTLFGTAKINAATTAVDVEFSKPITQSGGPWGVTKDGLGQVSFNGTQANLYTGATRVQAGTLILAKTAGVNAIPGNLDIFNGIARLTSPNQIADTSSVTVNGPTSTFDLNGNNETLSTLGGTGGNITLGGATLTATQGTYPGVISGAGMVVQENPGGGTSASLTLSGLNTFTGGVFVNHGSVTFTQQAPGHTGSTLNAGSWRVFNGSSLNFNVGSNITSNLADVTLSGATSTFAKINNLSNNGGSFTITAGKNFSAVGALSNSGTLTVGAGSTLTANSGLTNTGTAIFTGGLVASGTINTSGNLTLAGTQQFAAQTSLNVTGGVTALNSDAGAPGKYALSLSASGGTLQLGSTQHLANFVVSGAATVGGAAAAGTPGEPAPPPGITAGSVVLVTQAMTTTGAGTVDLQNNALVVDYSGSTSAPFNAVKAAILLGYNSPGTPWAGHGITSSTAAANASSYGIGYAEASTALGISGAQTSLFRGQTVDATSVLARFTELGDATLDGAVDFNDLVKLAQNYNTSGTSWNSGDFTYDGTTDFNDLVKLAQNYNTALPGEAIPGAPVGFEQDLARAFAQVPEPSGWMLVMMATMGAAGCRARRRTG